MPKIAKPRVTGGLFYFVFILIVAATPLIYTRNSLQIGGDIILPFNSRATEKYLTSWVGTSNGNYLSLNYQPFHMLRKLADIASTNPFFFSNFLIILLGTLSGFGTYKLTMLFVEKKRFVDKLFVLSTTTFYMMSPALLNIWHYSFVYAFVPLLFYTCLKCVKQGYLKYGEVLLLSIIFFFSSQDLPNPKYLFYSIVIIGFTILFSLNRTFLRKSAVPIILFFIAQAYILVPQTLFALNYQSTSYGIRDISDKVSKYGDYGNTTFAKIVRLYHDNTFLSESDSKDFSLGLQSNLISYAPFILVTVSLYYVGRRKLADKMFKLIVALTLLFFFIAVGPNEPLGNLYSNVVSSNPLLAFLRTTAGAVMYLAIAYITIIGIGYATLTHTKKWLLWIYSLGLLLAIPTPIITGLVYKNYNNKYFDKNIGIVIPSEYYRVANTLNTLAKDYPILIENSTLGYIETSWGFNGNQIYQFLFAADLLSTKDFDKLKEPPIVLSLRDSSLLKQSNTVNENYLQGRRTNLLQDGYLSLDLVIPSKPHRLVSVDTTQNAKINTCIPQIEYKRINRSLYLVSVYNSNQDFIIKLGQNYHKFWRLGSLDPNLTKTPFKDIRVNSYFPLMSLKPKIINAAQPLDSQDKTSNRWELKLKNERIESAECASGNRENKPYTFVLYFMPEVVREAANLISIFSLALCLVGFIMFRRKEK